MNFSYPKDRYWFIPKNYKKASSIKLIQVETFEDDNHTILALKKDSFVGIFKSIDELNKKMKDDNYLTIDSLDLENKRNIKKIGEEIIDLNKNLNKLEFYFVKDKYNCSPIFNINFLLTQRFNEVYEKTKKAFFEFTNGEINIDQFIELNNEKYLLIDLTNWNEDERKLLYTNSLIGVYYYYNTHSKRKSFDLGAYSSVIQSIKGKNTVQVYKEGIKWFSDEIKQKLRLNNYSFPELKKSSNIDYTDSFNDTFYNDQLDMDQQSPEFWDSI